MLLPFPLCTLRVVRFTLCQIATHSPGIRMNNVIDRLLAPYSSSGWLIGQKSKALLMANALILAAVGIDALLSLVLFGIHLGSIMGDLAIFVGVSSSSYLLLRGRYFPAASLGIGAALVAVVVVRLLNTGTFSLDSSYAERTIN